MPLFKFKKWVFFLREQSPILWFMLQMALLAKASPHQSWEPGTQPGPLCGCQEPNHLCVSSKLGLETDPGLIPVLREVKSPS